MATVIRLSRQGRKNRPHYKVGVFDSRTRRDGPPIEYLGHYDPLVADDEKKVTLDEKRIQYWLSEGARVSETVQSFLKKRGITATSVASIDASEEVAEPASEEKAESAPE